MNDAPDWRLDRLIGEAATDTLLAALRAGEACLVRGEPTRFAGLFDEPRFRAALARMSAAAPDHARFGAVVRDPMGDGLTFTEAIDVAAIDDVLASGHSICATDIGPHDPDLADALRSLARSLACPADLRFNAYLSPTGARTAMHTDVRISTTLQLTGRKRWRYQRRPAMVFPPSNAQLDRFGDVHWMTPVAGATPPLPPPDRHALAEVVLGPGDLLSVPAGAWHEVFTEEHALALNLSIRPTPVPHVVQALIEAAFAGDEAWRRGLPLLGPAARGAGVPAAVQECLRARLVELRAWIDRLDPAGPEVAALWRALVDR